MVIGIADPPAGHSHYLHGRRLKMEGESIREGGGDRITANIEELPVDRAYLIPDAEALPIVFDLLKHEGLCLGSSSGVNVAGAIRLARELGPGTLSSPFSPTTAPAIRASCSIPNSCAPRGCRCRTGSSSAGVFDYVRPQALRSTEWLEEHLYDPGLRIVDGSFHLPGSGRDPRAECRGAHPRRGVLRHR